MNNNSLVYFIINLFFSLGIFILGFLMLEFSTKFNIPPGHTFYVIIGCLLMAGALTIKFFLIKNRFFSKKKTKKKSKVVFINKDYTKTTREIE